MQRRRGGISKKSSGRRSVDGGLLTLLLCEQLFALLFLLLPARCDVGHLVVRRSVFSQCALSALLLSHQPLRFLLLPCPTCALLLFMLSTALLLSSMLVHTLSRLWSLGSGSLRSRRRGRGIRVGMLCAPAREPLADLRLDRRERIQNHLTMLSCHQHTISPK